MPFRSDPLDELSIPDGTIAEEHDLVTEGDVLVGGQSTVEFGVRGRNVLAGERVRFGGGLEASADCRLDMWSDVAESVLVGEDAYLGERVHIGGRLVVGGDLDIGDDVSIDDGFEANGWIVIRNPMPMIVFLVIYLSQLLRLGEEDAAQQLVSELVDDPAADGDPLVIPRGSEVSDDVWRVSTPARIGADCRLHGNIRATTIAVGEDTELFGSIRARGDVDVASGTIVHGDLTTRGGDVAVAEGVRVLGDVSCENLSLHREATVEGAIRARGEMRLCGDADERAEDAPSEDGMDDADGTRQTNGSETEVDPTGDTDRESAAAAGAADEGAKPGNAAQASEAVVQDGGSEAEDNDAVADHELDGEHTEERPATTPTEGLIVDVEATTNGGAPSEAESEGDGSPSDEE